MALATIQQIRDGQGSRLDSLSDTQIQLHLDDAAILIVALGIPVDSPYFVLLQKYKVYELLDSTGSIPNEINQESIGDVSIGMDTNLAPGTFTPWVEQFQKVLTLARGALFVC